ncbi:MAG TPA: hypothetical protein VFC03_19500 [Acidimicrobiales bacterium]|nr:hypothetical protein [Acidimicrobiales bacterium]
MKQCIVEFRGRRASFHLGAAFVGSRWPNGSDATGDGGGSTQTTGTFPFGVSLNGGSGGLTGSGGTAGSTGTTATASNARGAGHASGGGGAGCSGGATGYIVTVTSAGTGSGAKGGLALRAATEALDTPPWPSPDGPDTSLDGGSRHALPETREAREGGT